MDFQPLLSLIRESQSVSVYTHANADVDAVGACLSLKLSIEQLGKRCSVAAPESVSKIGRKLADEFSEEIAVSSSPPEGDLYVFVDVTPPSDWELEPTAVIDHHQVEEPSNLEFAFIDPNFTSASEMVFEFLQYLMDIEKSFDMTPEISALLLAGIIADTAGLRLSVKETLEHAVSISSICGVEVRDVFALLRTPRDRSLKIACLKGASRLKIRTLGDVILVITQVSSFQGDVASVLLRLGADIAFAAGKKGSVLKVSGRARTNMVKKGINLAQVMEAVAEEVGGEGGGHKGAAGMTGKGDVEDVLEMCLSETRNQIETG